MPTISLWILFDLALIGPLVLDLRRAKTLEILKNRHNYLPILQSDKFNLARLCANNECAFIPVSLTPPFITLGK